MTADHQVQQTRFGGGTPAVTANFGDQEYQGLPGGCADARLRGDSTPRQLCPGNKPRATVNPSLSL
ncbi:hypothetical protein GCM10009555_009290 [Acrocarpospora macrocephala]|uniref:Uncharacterized protein n=1 Tax=Acrocarpospora macrocephala TaxID=150177 RepID=A0A5M3WQN7_9ACTN|nr:hypothetical protein [Acrocarpospora macrocephala]GES10462.1 hypothetical protein Amac_040590 [Acrocarpospora macrocephala]